MVFVSFLLPLTSVSQIINEKVPILLKTEKVVYSSGETIKLSFSFDTLEVIFSNFGGCGGGPIFVVQSIDRPGLGDIHPFSCDLLIQEFNYAKRGTFEITIREPGIYSIVLYIKNQDFVDSDEWSTPIQSNEFEVVKK